MIYRFYNIKQWENKNILPKWKIFYAGKEINQTNKTKTTHFCSTNEYFRERKQFLVLMKQYFIHDAAIKTNNKLAKLTNKMLAKEKLELECYSNWITFVDCLFVWLID